MSFHMGVDDENVVHMQMECYSVVRKNEIIYMDLEKITLSNVSKTQKRQMSHILSHLWFHAQNLQM